MGTIEIVLIIIIVCLILIMPLIYKAGYRNGFNKAIKIIDEYGKREANKWKKATH